MVTTQALPTVAANECRSIELGSAVVKVRSGVDGSEWSASWSASASDALQSAAPWRTFRWYKGQKHYSGVYWSATCGGHVIYESRLELARLLLADFDRCVSWVVAQPFLLEAVIDGRWCRHVPDYLLVTSRGPVVVDVKPAAQACKPVVAQTFAWTRRVVESRGWAYEVWTRGSPIYLANVRFLAGYRRGQHFPTEVVERMASADLIGLTVAEAIARQESLPGEIARAALMHVLWRQRFIVDLQRPLSSRHVLRGPA